ncbi:DUF4224 domain-containing protein [Methylophilus sp. YYY-1]|nr:DUF4224 domain-containing protein [Methylophilus sp. YYY-1]
MFLTSDEIQELTGFKATHKQCEWLSNHGYPFDTTRSGRPKVLRSYIEQRLGMQHLPQTGFTPDFSALA